MEATACCMSLDEIRPRVHEAWTGVRSLPHGLLRVARVTLASESRLPNERRSPPERLFDRIQFWSAGADIHAGGRLLHR